MAYAWAATGDIGFFDMNQLTRMSYTPTLGEWVFGRPELSYTDISTNESDDIYSMLPLQFVRLFCFVHNNYDCEVTWHCLPMDRVRVDLPCAILADGTTRMTRTQ